MRLPALLALMLLGWTFPAGGHDITGSKQLLDGMRRLDGVPPAVISTSTPRWRFQVMAIYPHDIWAFSEGLELHNGELLESTGGVGYSSLRRVHLGSGMPTQANHMDAQDFGEGLAVAGD